MLKRNKYIEHELISPGGESKGTTRGRKHRECVTLNKYPFNTIFLFTHGECNLQIGLINHVLKSNDLVIIPEHVIYHTSCLVENNGYCIHFKTEYLLSFLRIGSMADILPFTLTGSKYVLPLTADQANTIKILFEEIYKEYDGASQEKDNIIRCYIEILLLKVKEYFHGSLSLMHSNTTRSLQLTKQFKALVEKNFIKMRRVNEYADILHICSKHLEKTIKETLGVTPKQLIHDFVLAEAKLLLKQTDKTISEIAYELKFEDQSYFSRFFKKRTSITPQEYRDMV